MRRSSTSAWIAVFSLVFASFAHTADALVSVATNITVDTIWGDDPGEDQMLLELPIFVKNNATLTILPGVIVRGQPRSGPVAAGVTAGTPGTLIVTRGASAIIDASASNPIIMTTAAVDNDNDNVPDDADANGFEDAYPGFVPGSCASSCVASPSPIFYDDSPKTAPLAPLDAAGNANVALWGGLVILGKAPTNLADVAGVGYGEGIIEGVTVPGFPAADATYGGVEPHDSSGVYRFLSVRHAGDEIGVGNELNGVSLGAVGDGTLLENVEVYCNFDDGFEWFGGTVNAKNLIVVFAGDDTFDLDQGYHGTTERLFGIMPFFNENAGTPFGSLSGDRAGEFDGDDFLPLDGQNINIRTNFAGTVFQDQGWVASSPAMYNMTIIGSTPTTAPDFTPVSPAADNRGIYMRHGFAGAVLNSIVINTGSRAGLELGMALGQGLPDTATNVAGDLIRLVASTLDDGTTPVAGAAALAISNGDAAVPTDYNNSGTANAVNDAGFLGLVNEDVSFDPRGNANGKLDATLKSAPIDPRPKTASAPSTLGGGVTTGPEKGATYRGAFPLSTPLWTDGWTVLSIAGLL